MSWETPTTADVLAQFTYDESDSIAINQGSGSGTPTNHMQDVLTAVVAEVRDYIRSGDYDLDDDETTIPEGLFNDAIAICKWRLLISLPKAPTLETDVRERAFNMAMEKLYMIAAGQFAVEPPSGITTLPIAGNWNSDNKIPMRTHPVIRPLWPAGVTPYANPNAPEDIP